jgi:hypothetical protein
LSAGQARFLKRGRGGLRHRDRPGSEDRDGQTD